jgi:hypothetical protein
MNPADQAAIDQPPDLASRPPGNTANRSRALTGTPRDLEQRQDRAMRLSGRGPRL